VKPYLTKLPPEVAYLTYYGEQQKFDHKHTSECRPSLRPSSSCN